MRLPIQRVLTLWMLGAILVSAPAAWGHARSHSFSDWIFNEGTVHMTFTVAELEVQRLHGSAGSRLQSEEELLRRLVEALESGVELDIAGRACESTEYELLPSSAGFLRVGSRFTCPRSLAGAGGANLTVTVFFDQIPDHLHFAKVRRLGDSEASTSLSEWVFSADEQSRRLSQVGESSVFIRYLVLGVEHILIGLDHLAFVLALLILCSRLRDLVWLITGFTVGHSITLSLAVLGWVEPDIPVIEAFIGFTIALVAAEHVARSTQRFRPIAAAGALALGVWAVVKLVGGPGLPLVTLVGLAAFTAFYLNLAQDERWAARSRPALTIGFGLVHGFGFASVLMDLGLAPGRLAASLLGFNLGVELGQLMVVGLLLVPAALLRLERFRSFRGPLLDVLAAFLCALGLFWLVQRGLTV